jgi:hypothetical protein
MSIKKTAAIAILCLLALPGYASAASSPFEIELRDLQQDRSVPRAAQKPRSVPRSPRRIPRGYVKYTVRGGENLFTILTRRFNLSPRRAENVTPRILRINGISPETILSVGQTILLPASVVKEQPEKPREPSQAKPVEQPKPPAAVKPSSEAAQAPVPPPASPAPKAAPVRYVTNGELSEIWKNLFPGLAAASVPVGAGSDQLAPIFLPLPDGSRITVLPEAASREAAGRRQRSRG